MPHPPPGPGADPSARGSHLDSWKEIAAYLTRDIRTVQRWEKQEGLPVHRHQHDERGTAYAYSGEIDEWLEKRRGREKPAARPIEPRRTRATLYYWAGAIAVGAIALLIWAFAGSREQQPGPLSVSSITFAPSEQFHEWGPEAAPRSRACISSPFPSPASSARP